jgi:hypothetical protein
LWNILFGISEMERPLGRSTYIRKESVEMFIKIVLSGTLPVVSTRLVVYNNNNKNTNRMPQKYQRNP